MNYMYTPGIQLGKPLPIARVWGNLSPSLSEKEWELIYVGPNHDHESATQNQPIRSELTNWIFDELNAYESYLFEFTGSYPISEFRFRLHENSTPCAHIDFMSTNLQIEIHFSLDKEVWQKVEPFETCEVTARYVSLYWPVDAMTKFYAERQFLVQENTSLELQFIAGKGIACESEFNWTTCFTGFEGWTGSDGIYSIAYSGEDIQGASRETKTLFLFGDTFIGQIDQKTFVRTSHQMINNSMAILASNEPNTDLLHFIWNESESGVAQSILLPQTEKSAQIQDSYYWLQDGVLINGNLYCLPILIGHNADGPEGFQFKVHGITRVRIPLYEENLQFDLQEQVDTDLCFLSNLGYVTYFGAAYLSLTSEALAPQADGYLYIYGIQQTGTTDLVVARCLANRFEEINLWEYWDGYAWGTNKEYVKPIAKEVSTEFSITPLIGGTFDRKYALVYMKGGLSPCPIVTISIGDSPNGPFTTSIPLFYCEEQEQGQGVYCYNAKAHPHLSGPGELLISYNVNSTSWAANLADSRIYRPRFVRMFEL